MDQNSFYRWRQRSMHTKGKLNCRKMSLRKLFFLIQWWYLCGRVRARFVLAQGVPVLRSMLTSVSACFLLGFERWPNRQTQVQPMSQILKMGISMDFFYFRRLVWLGSCTVRPRPRCSGLDKHVNLGVCLFLTGVREVPEPSDTSTANEGW